LLQLHFVGEGGLHELRSQSVSVVSKNEATVDYENYLKKLNEKAKNKDHWGSFQTKFSFQILSIKFCFLIIIIN